MRWMRVCTCEPSVAHTRCTLHVHVALDTHGTHVHIRTGGCVSSACVYIYVCTNALDTHATYAHVRHACRAHDAHVACIACAPRMAHARHACMYTYACARVYARRVRAMRARLRAHVCCAQMAFFFECTTLHLYESSNASRSHLNMAVAATVAGWHVRATSIICPTKSSSA